MPPVLRRLLALLLATGLCTAPPGRVQADPAAGEFEVCEWGLVSWVTRSDGSVLAGGHRYGIDLPGFVAARGGECPAPWYGWLDPLRHENLRQAEATEVLEAAHLAVRGPAPASLTVRRRLPQGMFTHAFPGPRTESPAWPASGPLPTNGELDWGAMEATPVGAAPESLLGFVPPVPTVHAWRRSRAGGSAILRPAGGAGPAEHFLYARGLSAGLPPVRATVSADGRVTLANAGSAPLAGAVVLSVPPWIMGGRFTTDPLAAGATIASAGPLAPGASVECTLAAPAGGNLEAVAGQARDLLEKSLVTAGLAPEAAAAAVGGQYERLFFTPGVRVLFVLPAAEAETRFPIEIVPAPRRTVRALLGCVEALDPAREEGVERTLAEYVESLKIDPWARLEHFRLCLLREGRCLEPLLRTATKSTRPGVADLARRLVRALGNPKVDEAPILGPDSVIAPATGTDPRTLAPEERRARLDAVTAWLARWEPYALETRCPVASGVFEAKLELALLRRLEERVLAGVAPTDVPWPMAPYALPLEPATCGCARARETGEMPKK